MKKREEFGRLLRYVMPYKLRLAAGVVCLSVVGLAEGLIALMITPIVGTILNPSAADNRLPLIANPFTHQEIYLNSFLPSQIHSVGTLFSIAILALFIGKGVAEYFGNVLVQYAGIAGVTDLRNQVYAKVIRQPIGFFQHHQTGRLLSTVINDVERVRNTFSEYLAFGFRHTFTFFFLLAVLFAINWKMTLGSVILLPMVVVPVRTLGKRIRRSTEKIQAGIGELSQILEETVSGNRVVKAFGMEDFEIGKFRKSARRLLRENMRWIRSAVVTSPMMDLLGAVVIVSLLLYARGQIKMGAMTARNFRHIYLRAVQILRAREGAGQCLPAIRAGFWRHRQSFRIHRPRGRAGRGTGIARAASLFSLCVEFDRVSFAYDPETAHPSRYFF